MGFYNTHSFKAQQQGNPFGTITFTQRRQQPPRLAVPVCQRRAGHLRPYQQQSQYIEGSFVYNNTEVYIQDNWRVNSPKLTLDYGLRLVHQQPQYDELGQASNFFLINGLWRQAPTAVRRRLRQRGGDLLPGPTGRRGTRRPGAFLGPNSTSAIGTLVGGTGNRTNGLIQSGQGIAKTTYTWPALALAPRFGLAYDITGTQTMVLRGGVGTVLRPARRQLDLLAGHQSAVGAQRHLAQWSAAVARHGAVLDRRRAGPHGLRIRRRSAVVHPVERGSAAGAAMGHVG